MATTQPEAEAAIRVLLERRDHGTTLDIDGPAGSRQKFGMEFAPQKNAHPALHVDDVAAARVELEAKEVEFAGETMDTGVCTDPDGNDLMLHHRYAAYD